MFSAVIRSSCVPDVSTHQLRGAAGDSGGVSPSESLRVERRQESSPFRLNLFILFRLNADIVQFGSQKTRQFFSGCFRGM